MRRVPHSSGGAAPRWLGPIVVVGSTALLVGLVVVFLKTDLWVTSDVVWWSFRAAPTVLGVGVLVGTLLTPMHPTVRRVAVVVQVVTVVAVLVSTVLFHLAGDPSVGAGLFSFLAETALLVVAVVSSLMSVGAAQVQALGAGRGQAAR